MVARLEPRRRARCCSRSARMSHHIGTVALRTGAGRRRRAGGARSPRRASRRSTGSSRPAPPTSWACRRTHRHPGRDATARPVDAGRRSRPSTWPARLIPRKWRDAFYRPGRQAAERLRHDRERLAPVHRRPTTTSTSSSRPAAGPAAATKCGCGTRRTRTSRSTPGEVGEIGGRGGAADARLLQQPVGHRKFVQSPAAGS